jgi:hypothetical protein
MSSRAAGGEQTSRLPCPRAPDCAMEDLKAIVAATLEKKGVLATIRVSAQWPAALSLIKKCERCADNGEGKERDSDQRIGTPISLV